MSTARRYDDPCGVARALDVIGDRWALLVVRELLLGPKRFVHLNAGLPGMSPNVLAQRLRDLETAGVVRRELLGPPARVAVYRLTQRGLALEPVLVALGRWGSAQPLTTSRELSVDALLLALRTVVAPRKAAAPDTTFALRIDGDWFRLTATAGGVEIAPERPAAPAVTLDTDVPTLRAVAFGRESIADAERDGRLVVTGDRHAAEAFARLFAVG